MNDARLSAAELDARDPLAAVRDRFLLPQGVVYLDGNSLGARPVGVMERLEHVVGRQWGDGLIRSWNEADWYDLDQLPRLPAKISLARVLIDAAIREDRSGSIRANPD